jgi:hypothetical protein
MDNETNPKHDSEETVDITEEAITGRAEDEEIDDAEDVDEEAEDVDADTDADAVKE